MWWQNRQRQIVCKANSSRGGIHYIHERISDDLLILPTFQILEECGYDIPLDEIEEVISYRSGVGTSGNYNMLKLKQSAV